MKNIVDHSEGIFVMLLVFIGVFVIFSLGAVIAGILEGVYWMSAMSIFGVVVPLIFAVKIFKELMRMEARKVKENAKKRNSKRCRKCSL